MMANAAFYYGALRTLAEDDRPLWTKMSFDAAHDNFTESAKHGIDARLYWPQLAPSPPTSWCCAPCCRWRTRPHPLGVDADVRDRYLGVIEGRAKTGHNGSTWQVAAVRALEERGLSRPRPQLRCCTTTAISCTATTRCTPGRTSTEAQTLASG